MVGVNIAFTRMFFRVFDKLSDDTQVDRLVELLESQKLCFSIFPILKWLNKIQKI